MKAGYIHNGKVVEKKPSSVYGFFMAILDLIRLFVLTIFTTDSMKSHTDEYTRSKQMPSWGKGGSTGRGSSNIHTFSKGAALGCGGGG